MPASLPIIATPLAQTASAPAGMVNARASGRSVVPDFTERLEAALGLSAGVPSDTGLAMPAPLAEAAVAAQPADITEPDANAPAAPAVSAAAKPLAVIPAVLTLPPADPIMASTAVRSNDTGAEPADAAPAPAAAPPQPAKPAADRGRAGRGTAAEPDSDKDAAVIDPAAPAGTAPLDPVLQPASTAPLSHADSPPSAIHPTHVNDSHAPPPATAPRNDAPQQTAQEPTQATTSQEQTPAAPSAETPPATPDAPAARRAAEASPDPIKAAIPAVHDAVSTEAVARAIAETSQPAAAPAGRTAQAAQSSAEPTRSEIPSPAQQIAAPLVALGTGPDQSRRMTVRLDPAALGAVQVRVDRPKEGPARVEITVERPETLSLLLRDQPQLQRALDQAGIPSEGRNVVLQIAAPDPQPRNDAPIPDHRQSDAGQPATGDSGARSEGYGGGGEGGGSGRGRRGGADEDGPVYRFTPSAAQRRLRDGLDITA